MMNTRSGLDKTLVKILEDAGYVLHEPITDARLTQLAAAAGSLPDGVVRYLATSDGLEHPKRGGIYGSEEMLKPYPSNSLLPLRGDGSGNYDSVIVEPGLCFGAVIFWDHETTRAEYLLASSVPTYLELLARYPTSERWDSNGDRQDEFLRAHDPAAPTLLDDPQFQALVGPHGRGWTVERLPPPAPGQPLPEGAREAVNPLTKERVVFMPTPRHRVPPTQDGTRRDG